MSLMADSYLDSQTRAPLVQTPFRIGTEGIIYLRPRLHVTLTDGTTCGIMTVILVN